MSTASTSSSVDSDCSTNKASGSALNFSICRLLQNDEKTKGTKTKDAATHESARSVPTFSQAETSKPQEVPKPMPPAPQASSSSAPICHVWSPKVDNLINTAWMSPDLQRRFVQDKLYTRRIGHPYQSRAPAKHKKPRTSFNKDQVYELEQRFRDQKYLASSERAALAQSLQMSDSQVKTWFQNRRTKWRRQAAEEREEERRCTIRQLRDHDFDDQQPPSYFARPDVTF